MDKKREILLNKADKLLDSAHHFLNKAWKLVDEEEEFTNISTEIGNVSCSFDEVDALIRDKLND